MTINRNELLFRWKRWGDSDRWLTLAGLIATDAVWGGFQKAWEPMLRNRYPIAPYIHMTDLVTGNDPFERRNGWTEDKVDKLVSDAKEILKSIDRRHIFTAIFSIDMKACSRLRDQGHDIPDPSVICAEFCLYHLLTRFYRAHDIELAYLFYDQDEPFIKSIRSRWRKHNDPKKLIVGDSFWGRLANIQPVDMRDTPAIQVADMVAWAATRRILNLPDDKWAPLANSLVGTRHCDGILPFTQVDPITEDEIRRRYPKS